MIEREGQAFRASGPTTGFWMGQTEVTVGEFEHLMGVLPNPAPGFNRRWQDPHQPLVSMTRDQAQEYCVRAGGRIPTDVEWAYAARAGQPGGDYHDAKPVPGFANLSSRAFGRDAGDSQMMDRNEYPTAPGSFSGDVNRWRLFDMSGNVSEMTLSSLGDGRVVYRGGSFASSLESGRFGHHDLENDPSGGNTVGFRCIIPVPSYEAGLSNERRAKLRMFLRR